MCGVFRLTLFLLMTAMLLGTGACEKNNVQLGSSRVSESTDVVPKKFPRVCFTRQGIAFEIRAVANATAEILTTLPGGATVLVLREIRKWYSLRFFKEGKQFDENAGLAAFVAMDALSCP